MNWNPLAAQSLVRPVLFLAVVLALVLSQIIRGLWAGRMLAAGKRAVLVVDRAETPGSFWTLLVFYAAVCGVLVSMITNFVNQMRHPGPGEPVRLTCVALDHASVELSWLPPERSYEPASYGIYRSESPGMQLSDYRRLATAPRPAYLDRDVVPNKRYFYRVTANYDGEPPAMSNEDSTVTAAPPTSAEGAIP